MSRKPGSRFFNKRQKQALYWIAQGKCEVCGNLLANNWHADHIIPFAQGGKTDVANGQALCPDCNRKKGATMIPQIEPRGWQKQFIENYFSKNQENYLLYATPGAGKTIASLLVVKQLLAHREIQQVVIVAPSDSLRSQWLGDAAEVGIQLAPLQTFWTHGIVYPEGCVGIVTTYSQVISKQQELRVLCSRKRTVLIADEVHHCGEGENKTWGPALEFAFALAKRRLLLSGTPFRSDNYKIQFVRYEPVSGSVVEEEAQADYIYGYGRALSDGEVIRPIIFPTYDGHVCWDNGLEIKEERLRNTHRHQVKE